MFVDRSTRDGEETVILRYAAAFYWLMWPTLGLTVWASLHSTTATNIAAGLAWLLMLAVAIPYWPIIFKLKRQMRDGGIAASGSKYSFTNPLTYRWANTDGDKQNG
jgi:hypothetical protein